MRLRVVEVILAAEASDVCVDAVIRERRDIEAVAARDEGPIVIEGRHVRVERAHEFIIPPQRADHLRMDEHILKSSRTRLENVNAAGRETRLDIGKDRIAKERIRRRIFERLREIGDHDAVRVAIVS